MDNMLTIAQATEQGFGSRATLMRRIKEGVLPSVKIGGRHYFTIEDLNKIKKEKKTKPTPYLRLIRRTCAMAPELTDEQRETIISILRSGRQS